MTGGKALCWRVKALRKGLTYLRTGATRYRTTSLLERFNREIRVRERMCTAWTVYNLLVLMQLRAWRPDMNHLSGNATTPRVNVDIGKSGLVRLGRSKIEISLIKSG